MNESDLKPWTEEDIRDYASTCGNKSAAALILLAGPDMFAGSYSEYLALYNELNNN